MKSILKVLLHYNALLLYWPIILVNTKFKKYVLSLNKLRSTNTECWNYIKAEGGGNNHLFFNLVTRPRRTKKQTLSLLKLGIRT